MIFGGCTVLLENLCESCNNLQGYLLTKDRRRGNAHTQREPGCVGVKHSCIPKAKLKNFIVCEAKHAVSSINPVMENSWLDVIRSKCGERNSQLIFDVITFIQMRGYLEYPVQTSLISRLFRVMTNKRPDDDPFCSKIGFLLLQRLGHSGYRPYQNILKLPAESTLKKHFKYETSRSLGFQRQTLAECILTFFRELLFQTIDDKRVARALHALRVGEFVKIFGKAMHVEVSKWSESELDLDQLREEAQKRGISELEFIIQKCKAIIAGGELAPHLGLHMFTCVSADIPGVVVALYSKPHKGFRNKHMVDIVLETRKLVFLDHEGNPKSDFPELIGIIIDNYYLPTILAFVNPELHTQGLKGLALGHVYEKHISYYIGPRPLFGLTDPIHGCSLGVSNILNTKRLLTLWKKW